MKHYDGPAFYRKQNDNIKKPIKDQTVRDAGVSSDKTVGKIFQPTYVPPSMAKIITKENLKQKYQSLISEILQAKTEYLLFDEQSQSLPLVDLTERIVFVEDYIDDGELDNDIAEEQEAEDELIAKEDVEVSFEAETRHEIDSSKPTPVVIAKEVIEKTAPILPQNVAKEIPVATLQAKEEASTKFQSEKLAPSTPQMVAKSVIEDSEVQAPIEKAPSVATFTRPTPKTPITLTDDFPKTQGYQLPSLSLLPAPILEDDSILDEWVLRQSEILNETLQAFNVDANVENWTIGPTVTQFEITLSRGVKVNKITNLTDDLKLALAAKDIRIEAPIPGKSTIGIEIPNPKSRPVMLAEVLGSTKFKEATSPLTIALGVDLFGQPQITDLKKMPHGLIAGATGSGKSVFINSLLISLLYKATPAEVKLILIDPKAVEMAPYNEIGHLLAPVISDPKAASAALKWVVEEMENRYQRLAASGARNIEAFNQKAKDAKEYGLQMPYIVVVIDELADLMMVAASEVQDYIARITAKARAAGIHLIIATQRPSVDVITGTIKNNIPARIAFMVSSQIDSRTILDTAGAERLLGRGDMLYLGNGASQPLRLQGTYIDEEVEQITDFVRRQGKPRYAFDPDGLKQQELVAETEDELFPRVLDYLVNEDNISTSKLQRVFSIGYNRAAGMIDTLEQKGYISSARGSKPREVYLTMEQLEKMRME